MGENSRLFSNKNKICREKKLLGDSNDNVRPLWTRNIRPTDWRKQGFIIHYSLMNLFTKCSYESATCFSLCSLIFSVSFLQPYHCSISVDEWSEYERSSLLFFFFLTTYVVV